MTLIYLIAGEASGDALGARLIAALRARKPAIEVAGIGGPLMTSQGVRSVFPMEELALMGFVEVLPRLRRLSRRLTETISDIAARRPVALVTIDSPGFALRVLRAVAPLGIKRVHYVAPQVWAWRESRVRRYPGLWDQLLCLLPFEPAFFARHGLPATFVGHPVLESGAGTGDATRFRAMHHVPAEKRVLSVLPGSRRAEVRRLLPLLGEGLRRLAMQDVTPVVPVAEGVAPMVRDLARTWPVRPVLVEGAVNKYDAFAASAAALTKSGTSTLELALARVPMLVTYRVNPISAGIARRLVTVRHAALVNLLADLPDGGSLVPELIQQDCTPAQIATRLRAILNDPAMAEAQRAGFSQLLKTLHPPGGLTPSEAAAEAIIRVVEQP